MLGIDLFAGSGGLSLGAALAGVEIRAAVELHPAACDTFRRNHPRARVIASDVAKVKAIDFGRRDGELILYGGPPCQGFSTSNQRTRNKANPKNWLFREFLRLVDIVGPEWVVFENVAGILQTEEGSFSKAFRSRLSRLGYRMTSGLLNAADFGCPQRRSRYFVVAARDREPPSLPEPTGATPPTLKEAIGDLPTLENGASVDILPYAAPPLSDYAASLRGSLTECTGHLVSRNADGIAARYRFIPQGGNWRDVPGMMRDGHDDRRRYHTGIYRRLRLDAPSVVIGNFRKNMLIHPTQDRGLSVREAARLQSFPDSYVFNGSIGLQQQQVGNAVPPALARVVFERIVAVAQGAGASRFDGKRGRVAA
jgi:DNA (cytosine-5)-methyltransferase 1